jgi:Ser/Thr protein kinase RdoA (MazF antagonist)
MLRWSTKCGGGGDAVRVIYFDYCGFGYWLYDLAVPLWDNRYRDDYPAYRAALLDGYAYHRELPDLTHLDDFMATRYAAFGLWYAGMAQINPPFAAGLAGASDSGTTEPSAAHRRWFRRTQLSWLPVTTAGFA